MAVPCRSALVDRRGGRLARGRFVLGVDQCFGAAHQPLAPVVDGVRAGQQLRRQRVDHLAKLTSRWTAGPMIERRQGEHLVVDSAFSTPSRSGRAGATRAAVPHRLHAAVDLLAPRGPPSLDHLAPVQLDPEARLGAAAQQRREDVLEEAAERSCLAPAHSPGARAVLQEACCRPRRRCRYRPALLPK